MAKCAECGHEEIDHDGDVIVGRCEYKRGQFECDCEGFIEPESDELEDFA